MKYINKTTEDKTSKQNRLQEKKRIYAYVKIFINTNILKVNRYESIH